MNEISTLHKKLFYRTFVLKVFHGAAWQRMRVPRAVEIRERPGFCRSQRPFVSPPLSRTFADNPISVGWQYTDISAIRGSRNMNSPPSRDFSGCQPPYYPLFRSYPISCFPGSLAPFVIDVVLPWLYSEWQLWGILIKISKCFSLRELLIRGRRTCGRRGILLILLEYICRFFTTKHPRTCLISIKSCGSSFSCQSYLQLSDYLSSI